MMKLVAAMPAAVAKLSAVPMALATGAEAVSFDVSSIMTDAVGTAQGQMFSVLKVVVPAIVGITVAVVGIKFGIGWIKKIRG